MKTGVESESSAPVVPDEVARQTRGRQKRGMNASGWMGVWVARLALVAIITAAWEWAVESGFLKPLYASQPSVIWEEFWDLVLSGSFWSEDVAATLMATLWGMLIGGIGGILTALLLAKFDFAYRVIGPFMVALYSLPKIALAPLMILWFGIGLSSKVALVVSVVYFAMFYNTYGGVRAVDPDLINSVRMMGGGQGALWRQVTLPSATPWMFAGLRVSLAFALTAAVVGELIASQVGVGNVLSQAAGSFQTGRVFAALIVLGAFGVASYAVMDMLEARFLKWRGDSRSSAPNPGM